MTTYFFVGDGSEVLACEAYEANAREEMKRLQQKCPHDADAMNVYECDPSELTTDSSGKTVWAYPAERALAEKEYELPTLEECIAQVS